MRCRRGSRADQHEYDLSALAPLLHRLSRLATLSFDGSQMSSQDGSSISTFSRQVERADSALATLSRGQSRRQWLGGDPTSFARKGAWQWIRVTVARPRP